MTLFDLTYFWRFGDRFAGGNRFFFSNYQRIPETEQQVSLRSNCEITEAQMTVTANNTNTPFNVGIRKNGDGLNNPAKDASTISWLANETGTKVF